MSTNVKNSENKGENEIEPNLPIADPSADSSEPQEYESETEPEEEQPELESETEPEEEQPELESETEPEEEQPELGSESEVESKYVPPTTLRRNLYGPGPSTVIRPRKRVVKHGKGKGPMIPPLSGDPYLGPKLEIDEQIGITRETLYDWRKLDIFPKLSDVSEATKARFPITGEPPHHTIPILVAHGSRQDERLDIIENRLDIMEDACDNLPNQVEVNAGVNNVYFQATIVREFTENIKGRVIGNEQDVKEIKSEFGAIHCRLNLLEAFIRNYIREQEDKQKGTKRSRSC